MEAKVRKTIEEIMGDLRCPNNFVCAESGFEVLCRARRIGMDDHLECLESDPAKCKFASPFLNVYLCKCPIRGYVFEKLNK